MKKITAVLLALTFVLAVSSCSKNTSGKENDTNGNITETGIKEISDTVQEEPFEYKELYTWSSYYDVLNNPWNNDWFSIIDEKYAKLTTPEKIKEFQNQFDVNGGDKTFIEYNIYNFIKFTGIQKEDFIKAKGDSDIYSDEETDIIFASDKTKEKVYEYFLTPSAIMVNGEIYTIDWLLEHRYYDYVEKGITSEMIEAKMPIIEEIVKAKGIDDSLDFTNFKSQIRDLKLVEADPDVFKKDPGYYSWMYFPYYDVYTCPWKNRVFGGLTLDLTRMFPEDEVSSFFDKVYYNAENTEGYYFTVYEFIKSFNVKKTDFIEKLGYLYSEEEINMIFADDKTKEEIYKYFVVPHAIIIDEKIYTVEWLSSHDANDYINAGITVQILEEKLSAIRTFMTDNFGDDYCDIVVKNIEKNIAELRTAG